MVGDQEIYLMFISHFIGSKSDLRLWLAAFIKVIDEAKWQSILHHCSFDYMKKMPQKKSVPLGGAFWDGGAQTFIHKGTKMVVGVSPPAQKELQSMSVVL
jgi:hypothetical protein